MEPLIDELLELYKIGVPAFNVSVLMVREKFTLKATLLWTIRN
jgi:hypothetical protein